MASEMKGLRKIELKQNRMEYCANKNVKKLSLFISQYFQCVRKATG